MTIKVLATGTGWIGGGIESIQTNIYEIMEKSEREIILGTYSFDIGAIEIIKYIERALERKVDVNLFINDFYSKNKLIQEELKRLLRKSLYLKVYNFSPGDSGDFHAKIIISDRKAAIIGSSNLSGRGFIMNHELAILIEDDEVSTIALALDKLKFLHHVNEVTV